jgi:hypothetical protein
MAYFGPALGLRFRKIQYRIKLNEAGQWTETGEWSRDEETWNQFFGMTLDRVK